MLEAVIKSFNSEAENDKIIDNQESLILIARASNLQNDILGIYGLLSASSGI